MASITRYFALDDDVVGGVDSDGLARRFVPGEGLVDWPSLTGVAHGFEPGARDVDLPTAMSMIRRGVGRVAPDVVARNRGDAPTIRIPRL